MGAPPVEASGDEAQEEAGSVMPFHVDGEEWADCIVPGCPNRCCKALGSDKCFPHTEGDPHIKRLKIAMNRVAAFGESEIEEGSAKP